MENIIKLIPGTFLLYSGKYDFDNETEPFKVNNNFYYLTSLDIPNLAILYNHIKKQYFYFFEYRDIVWFDNNSFLKEISSEITILDIKDIDKYINNIQKIFSLNNFNNLSDIIKSEIIIDSINIDKICNEMRVIKKKKEIKNIENACQISSEAIIDIIKNCRKINNEEDIVSRFKKYILKYNIDKMAYLPICSNGKNNSILHYVYNKNKILHNNLILLDIGCKYNNYCADITRTFPKSGKFTKNQKIIYSIVLECQKYSINLLKDNVDWKNLQISTRLFMYELLLKNKLVLKTESKNEKIKVTNVFMPHGLGHTVGLDVHDTNPNGKLKILKKNMIITIEPGIYFIKHLLESNDLVNHKEIQKYMRVGGIRIEDTILIQKSGCKVLSNCPKEINEIEGIIL